jgi:hypothetical protein
MKNYPEYIAYTMYESRIFRDTKLSEVMIWVRGRGQQHGYITLNNYYRWEINGPGSVKFTLLRGN